MHNNVVPMIAMTLYTMAKTFVHFMQSSNVIGLMTNR